MTQDAGAIRIEPGALQRVHPALLEAGFHALHSVRIENVGESPLRDVELRVRAEPAFVRDAVFPIAELPPGGVLLLDGERLPLRFDAGLFRALTERARATLSLEVVEPAPDAPVPIAPTPEEPETGETDAADPGPEAPAPQPPPAPPADSVLASAEIEVDLCPVGDWPGLAVHPEHLASFVLPNEAAVQGLLKKASDLLGEWTGDPALCDYQSKDPARVLRVAAATYAALQAADITYATSPASFSTTGQRVRLPADVLASRMGNCLDAALLHAACLEQAGLHPLVLLVHGHAVTGVWLDDETFTEAAVVDVTQVAKHVELGHIAVFDSTCATTRPSPDFDAAQSKAWDSLLHTPFEVAIDVTRARRAGIRPIATQGHELQGVGAGDAPIMVSAAPTTDGLTRLEELERSAAALAARGRDRDLDRLDLWRSKLLDLTMRNRLLAHRPSARTLELLWTDPAALEDALSGGAAFRVLHRPSEFDEERKRDPKLQRSQIVERITPLLESEYRAGRLRADATEASIENKLVTLYREARTAVEEGGASTLFLAVGFLHFSESRASTQQRSAPILLVPVELTRESVRKGFSLRVGADDPRINVTLLEYLARDHGIEITGLDPLPEDESGIDVELVLHVVRQAVKEREGWFVTGGATVDIFSFSKILIWKDLADRREELLGSPVVDHLVHHATEEWNDGIDFPDLDRLDDDHAAHDLLCPMSFDSSQLAAVVAAAAGKSFVLHGPPGTGKSQTITNLIAHLLATGKRVLFVSEKRAALDVVRERIERVGLGEACLELHSNKARKREVLEQLRQALEAATSQSDAEWRARADEYEETRRALNTYVEALHRPRTSGESAFQALARLVSIEPALGVDLTAEPQWHDVGATTPDQLAAARDAVQGLIRTGADVRPTHPLLGFARTDYTLQWDREAQPFLAAVEARLGPMREAARAALRCVQMRGVESDAPLDRSTWAAFVALATALRSAPEDPPRELLAGVELDGLTLRAQDWLDLGRRLVAARAALAAKFSDDLRSIGLEDLELLARQSRLQWCLPAWFKKRRLVKALRSIAHEPKSVSFESALEDLKHTRRLEDLEQRLEQCGDAARAAFGPHWRGEESDWAALDALVAWAREYEAAAEALAEGLAVDLAVVRDGMLRAMESGTVAKELVTLVDAWSAYEAVRADADRTLDLEERAWDDAAAGAGPGVDAFAADADRLAAWNRLWPELPGWCAWRRARATAVTVGLTPLVAALESGERRCADLSKVFERSFADAWFTVVASVDPALARFVGTQHDLLVRRFRDLDEELLALTRDALRARTLGLVGGALPPGRTAPASSELGILQRELTKKSRHKALRRLFAEIPSVLEKLKPCMLMSPLSVAQYLDPAGAKFDAVVFDEASQIPVQDAIGAIARGQQVIVVGDPKQLPPTRFFERGGSDDDEAELLGFVEDAESILDECLAARLPSLYLGWHYRSRHESLIAFSNRRYYEGRLVTFPAREDESLGVALRYIEGAVYDHGKSRTNRLEADAVVAEVERRLEDPLLRERSIGVVTFNQQQQHLIEDLLDELRRRRPELEQPFTDAVREPLFVKNLENVQGDERDVILFSIGFGPDLAGKVHLNFGPLNRSGGERRLNVAITRARQESLVFTCLRPEHIDLGRTQADGARDLKLFLEYAERGPLAFAAELERSPLAESESPFEEEVGQALVARGWKIERQVGCSGYRLDLAVADPAESGRFLLGVECDGAMYHSAKTARDRDALRQSVLEGLGWRIHRIWSTEWWRNREREIERLLAALEEARAADARLRAERERLRREAEEIAAATGEAAESQVEDPVPEAEAPGTAEHEPEAAESPSPGTDAAPAADAPGTPYLRAKLTAGKTRSAKAFYQPSTEALVAKAFGDLVTIEAPIAQEAAARRVADAWGVERLTAKARAVLDAAVLRSGLLVEDDAGTAILWGLGADPAAYVTFRPAAPEQEDREIEDIATRELANAGRWVLATFGGLERDDFLREMARIFGTTRLGSRVRPRLEHALARLVDAGDAECEGDLVRPA